MSIKALMLVPVYPWIILNAMDHSGWSVGSTAFMGFSEMSKLCGRLLLLDGSRFLRFRGHG
jgi:hypothetical protein